MESLDDSKEDSNMGLGFKKGFGRGLMDSRFHSPISRGRSRGRGRARSPERDQPLPVLDDSLFCPGGSSSNAPTPRRSVHFADSIDDELARKRREICSLELEAESWREHIDTLGMENEQMKRQLDSSHREYFQVHSDLNRITMDRDDQVTENETVRVDILQETDRLKDNKDCLIRELADLQGRKSMLDEYMRSTRNRVGVLSQQLTADENSSSNGDTSTPIGSPFVPKGRGARVLNTMTEFNNRPGNNVSVTSGYTPFINDNASQNVMGNVYSPSGRGSVPSSTNTTSGRQGPLCSTMVGGASARDALASRFGPRAAKNVSVAKNVDSNDATRSLQANLFTSRVSDVVNTVRTGIPEATTGNRVNVNQTDGDGYPMIAYPNGNVMDGTYINPTLSGASPRINRLYQSNPAVAGLGLDTVSRRSDGYDIVEQSVRMATGLKGSSNAARRIACQPRPYHTKEPWVDWLSGVMDDINLSGWTEDEALPYLCKSLREGDGKIALDRWKEECGPRGTFVQLIECASYVFGTINRIDPRMAFKNRTQKPGESPKVYGLALQSLLRKAHPRMNMEDEYFMNEFWVQFVGGLRDPELQRVVYDNWKGDSSLNDVFRSIDDHYTKKTLMSGKLSYQTAAPMQMEGEGGSESQLSEFETEDSNLSAARFQKRSGVQYPPRKEGQPDNPKDVKIVPKVEKKVTEGVSAELLERMIIQITDSIDRRRSSSPKEKVDKSKKNCYRCQELGHFASDCLAEKPVYKVKEGN